MSIGASTFVEDVLTEMDAAEVNTFEPGLNVYHSPGGGLNYRVSAGSVRLRDRYLDIAAIVSDQAVTASVTTYVFVDRTGAVVDNETGFPVDEPHIPLAQIGASGVAITSVADKRPQLSLSAAAVGKQAWRTGRVYTTRAGVDGGTLAGAAIMAADTLHGFPIPIASWARIDRIMVHVTTAIAASSVRLGLYAESLTARGEPGVLLEDLGTVATTSTGVKQLVVAPSRALAPGLYFVAAIKSDVLLQFNVVSAPVRSIIGHPDGDLITVACSWRGTDGGNPAAVVLPDPFPATPTSGETSCLILGLRGA